MHHFKQKFYWEGIDATGKRISGYDTAMHRPALKKILFAKKITPLIVRRQLYVGNFLKNKLSRSIFMEFYQQLSLIVSAHLSLTEALMILAKNQKSIEFKKILEKCLVSISQGHSLSDALAQFPQYFSTLERNIIYAGEQCGDFIQALNHLVHLNQQKKYWREQLQKALFYPLTVLIISTLLILGLFLFVVPEIKSFFANSQKSLPIYTQTIIHISDLTCQYGWLGFLSPVLFWIIRQVYRKNLIFHYHIDRWILGCPGIAMIIKTWTLARWSQTLSISLAAHIPLIDALILSESSMQNLYLLKTMQILPNQINQGASLYQACQKIECLPNTLVEMIGAGEISSQLVIVLQQISQYYLDRIDKLINRLSKLIEPVMMLILAGIIGSLVVGLYYPVFQLGNTFT